MAEPTTKQTKGSVTAFIGAVADRQRRQDCRTVLKMMQQATGEKPVMWGTSIVGFGRYEYRYASGRSGEWPLIGFSPRKNDLTLYIMPGVDRFEQLTARLGKHKTGKSCLYIKKVDDVDLTVLQALIEASVKSMPPKRTGG